MRMLVISWYVVPGYSGGWTTVLDLLQPEHQVVFLVATGPCVTRTVEGVKVVGLGVLARMTSAWPALNRLREAISTAALRRAVSRVFSSEQADLALCLDELSGRAALAAGVPYALRLHSHPGILGPEEYEQVLSGALFATGSEENIPGTEFLPHGVDLDRFTYTEPDRAEGVIMPTSLVAAEGPELFVRGVARSGQRGVIVGQGPMRTRIARLCSETSGRVALLPPATRSELPGLLSSYQIGVACLQKGWRTTYQMKVTEYQAAGLFPLVQPWSELARVRPDLTRTFTDELELAAQIDWVAANWSSTLRTRRKNLEFARSTYHVARAKELFARFLERIR